MWSSIFPVFSSTGGVDWDNLWCTASPVVPKKPENGSVCLTVLTRDFLGSSAPPQGSFPSSQNFKMLLHNLRANNLIGKELTIKHRDLGEVIRNNPYYPITSHVRARFCPLLCPLLRFSSLPTLLVVSQAEGRAQGVPGALAEPFSLAVCARAFRQRQEYAF